MGTATSQWKRGPEKTDLRSNRSVLLQLSDNQRNSRNRQSDFRTLISDSSFKYREPVHLCDILYCTEEMVPFLFTCSSETANSISEDHFEIFIPFRDVSVCPESA